MKKIVITQAVALLGLVGCSNYSTYQEKMHRYNPKILKSNHVPEIKTPGFTFKTQSRMPASFSSQEKNKIEEIPESAPSNKKLYFLTLLGQYEGLKSFASNYQAPNVEICPHFHTSILELKDSKSLEVRAKANKKYYYDHEKLQDESYVAQRPELSLPLVKDEVYPKVVDILKKENDKLSSSTIQQTIGDALDIHLAKTYTEIRQLCEFGVSDNYYIYENLITHIKSTSFNAKTENLETLLKTTVFSNLALVTSLEKNMTTRTVASQKIKDPAKVYSNELLTRLNINWAHEYLDYIKNTK